MAPRLKNFQIDRDLSKVGARINFFYPIFLSFRILVGEFCKVIRETLRPYKLLLTSKFILGDFVSSMKMLLMWSSAFERRRGGVDEQMKSVELHSISCICTGTGDHLWRCTELNQHETKRAAR